MATTIPEDEAWDGGGEPNFLQRGISSVAGSFVAAPSDGKKPRRSVRETLSEAPDWLAKAFSSAILHHHHGEEGEGEEDEEEGQHDEPGSGKPKPQDLLAIWLLALSVGLLALSAPMMLFPAWASRLVLGDAQPPVALVVSATSAARRLVHGTCLYAAMPVDFFASYGGAPELLSWAMCGGAGDETAALAAERWLAAYEMRCLGASYAALGVLALALGLSTDRRSRFIGAQAYILWSLVQLLGVATSPLLSEAQLAKRVCAHAGLILVTSLASRRQYLAMTGLETRRSALTPRPTPQRIRAESVIKTSEIMPHFLPGGAGFPTAGGGAGDELAAERVPERARKGEESPKDSFYTAQKPEKRAEKKLGESQRNVEKKARASTADKGEARARHVSVTHGAHKVVSSEL